MSDTKTLKDFTDSYHGMQCLKTNHLNDNGIWVIRGEDSGCDAQSCPNMPVLGYVTGILRDVIEYAVLLPRFYTWGSGGSIERIQLKHIEQTASKQRRDLLEKQASLTLELNSIKKQLGE